MIDYFATLIIPFVYPKDHYERVQEASDLDEFNSFPRKREGEYNSLGHRLFTYDQYITGLEFINHTFFRKKDMPALLGDEQAKYRLRIFGDDIYFKIKKLRLFFVKNGIGFMTIECDFHDLNQEQVQDVKGRLCNLTRLEFYEDKKNCNRDKKDSSLKKKIKITTLTSILKDMLYNLLDLDSKQVNQIRLSRIPHMVDYLLIDDLDHGSEMTMGNEETGPFQFHIEDFKKSSGYSDSLLRNERLKHVTWLGSDNRLFQKAAYAPHKITCLVQISQMKSVDKPGKLKRDIKFVRENLLSNIRKQYMLGFLFYLSLAELIYRKKDLEDLSHNRDNRILSSDDLFGGIDCEETRNRVVIHFAIDHWNLEEKKKDYMGRNNKIIITPGDKKIFLASSVTELKDERIQIGDYIRKINNLPLFTKIGVELILIKCEDLEQSRKNQEEINKEIEDSDYVVFLFKEKCGDETRRELELVLNKKRKILVFCYGDYIDDIDAIEDQNLREVYKSLTEKKIYATKWSDIDTIKEGIFFQLVKDLF